MGAPVHADSISGLTAASRYRLLLKIASGGMGTVYLGHQRGAAGFQRLVAVKKAHPHLLEDAQVMRMLVMEARLASLIRHPNVVSVTDVEDANGELLLVMDYVEGAALSELISATAPMSLGIAMRVIIDACEGLEALHSAIDEDGASLGLVHRDVSPQNVLVGVDGVARLADFGIARAYAVENTTNVLRGKPAYMSPEYAATAKATASSDVFALGVVAWETLTQQRLFKGLNDVDAAERVRSMKVPPPSAINAAVPKAVDGIVLRAIERNPTERFASARAFAAALIATTRNSSDFDDGRDLDPEARLPWIATRADVGDHVARTFESKLSARREMLRRQTPVAPYDVAFGATPSADETPRPTTTDPPVYPPSSSFGRATPLTASQSFDIEPPSSTMRAFRLARIPVIASAVVCLLALVATTVTRNMRGEPPLPSFASAPETRGALALGSPSAPETGATDQVEVGAPPVAVAPRAAPPTPALPPARGGAAHAGTKGTTAPASITSAAASADVGSPTPPASAAAPPTPKPASRTPLLLAPPSAAPENPYGP